jgi:hypothetical protein
MHPPVAESVREREHDSPGRLNWSVSPNKILGAAKAPMANRIGIERCYKLPSRSNGARFLVGGLWPRGVRKEAIRLAGWVREVAPSQKPRKCSDTIVLDGSSYEKVMEF